MIIPVVGFDPSFRNWGSAEAFLCLTTGVLTTPVYGLVQPTDLEGKQVRQNSTDLWVAEQLSAYVIPMARKAKVIFVEVPVGSQSASAMKGYGVCIGVLGAIRALGIPLVEVTPKENKKVFTGNANATKAQMIEKAVEFYPEAVMPTYVRKGQTLITESQAEHMADAVAAIHSGVKTPTFQNLMRLFQGV